MAERSRAPYMVDDHTRAIYYDRYGKSHQLPADPENMQHYLNKGFTLSPPSKPIPMPRFTDTMQGEPVGVTEAKPQPKEKVGGCVCSKCGFACKNEFGLRSHMRFKHKGG